MNSNKQMARIVGGLYITATVAGILSIGFMGSILDKSNYLKEIASHENQVITGGLCELIMGIAVAGIAFMIYPLLKKTNEGLALWYVGARLLESMLYAVSVLCLLLLVTLSQDFVDADAANTSQFQTLGDSLLAARDWAGGALNSTMAFGLSAVFFYYLLYESRLVPRWLSVWGLIGAPLWIAAGLITLYGKDPQSTIPVLLYMPIAINEMVLAVWLVVKGFNSTEEISESPQLAPLGAAA